MIRSRLFPKAAASLTLVILIVSVLTLLLVTPRVEREALAALEESLLARATLLEPLARPALAGRVDPALDERVVRLGTSTATRITIIREDGTVLADTARDSKLMEPHDQRPEVRAARETRRPATATRTSRTTGVEMRYLAIPVREGDRILGYVRTSLPTTLVSDRRASIRRIVALGAGGAALIGLVLTLLLTRRLTRRLTSMARAARDIAEGREPGRLRTDIADETGDIARDLERLSEQRDHRMRDLVGEQSRLTAVLASMTEGVVAVDASGRVMHMNVVAARLLHADPTGSIGRRIEAVTGVSEVRAALEAVLGSDTAHVREIRLGEGRTPRVLEVRASPLRDAKQDLSGAVIVLHDVTELLRLETVRRDFVANVSHELKTPLTAIRGLLETLLDDEAMDAVMRTRFLEKARDQGLRLSALVTDLLALSRIESGAGVVEHRRMDLRDPLREAVRRLDPGLAGRRLTVEIALPDAPVFILGDEEAIRQIVDNLLDNALKYTPDAGRICVRLMRRGDEAVVEVEDTGIGIETKHLDRIFERFYRVDKARSRELGGTGLGLAIVKHLVEALHGRLHLESEIGRGSTFRFTIPLSHGSDGLPGHVDVSARRSPPSNARR